MTLREYLKKRLEKEYLKAPKKIWNKNNLEMVWNEDKKLYIGIDSKGEEWIASLQHSRIPIFSVKCTNLQRKGDAEVYCGAINFLPICDDGTIQCHKCNKPFTIELNVSKESSAYEILENLDK